MSLISKVTTATFHPSAGEPVIAGRGIRSTSQAGGEPANVLRGLDIAGDAFRSQRLALFGAGAAPSGERSPSGSTHGQMAGNGLLPPDLSNPTSEPGSSNNPSQAVDDEWDYCATRVPPAPRKGPDGLSSGVDESAVLEGWLQGGSEGTFGGGTGDE